MKPQEKNLSLRCGEPGIARRFRTACAARFLLFLLVLPAAVQAQDYIYTTNDGTITITKYIGLGGDVAIPERIDDLPVATIGNWAFQSCTILSSVAIPNTVTYIGVESFSWCDSLTDVAIPDGVTNVGDYAFSYCFNLTNLSIGSRVSSIGGYTVLDCSSLATISVNSSNTAYSSVDGVLFDKNQTTLLRCPPARPGIYSVPSSVTTIATPAFNECASLAEVAIPPGVILIEDIAFLGCTSLMAITVDASNPAFASLEGILFDKNKNKLVRCPEGKAGNYEVPKSATSIGRAAFLTCASLGGVVVPDSVTSIGDEAFAGCYSLSNVSIGAGIASIPHGAFNSCWSLSSVMIGSRVTSIGDSAFYWCRTLTNITLPQSVTSIDSGAFLNCFSLANIYFQGNAPSIGSGVFDGVTSATIFYLPGTTNWGATFGGRPTAVWALPYPVVLNSGPSFGVQPTGFGFTISWATNIPVVVGAATNLANPVWLPVGTNTLTNGSAYFSDPGWTNHPGRFYRLRSP